MFNQFTALLFCLAAIGNAMAGPNFEFELRKQVETQDGGIRTEYVQQNWDLSLIHI